MSSQAIRTVTCGQCHQQGHNRRTCPSRNVTIRPRKVKKLKKIILKKKAVVEPCSICFDDCSGKTCTLECGHKFHTKCIFTWFEKTNNCPLCRAKVPEIKSKRVGSRWMEPPVTSRHNNMQHSISAHSPRLNDGTTRWSQRLAERGYNEPYLDSLLSEIHLPHPELIRIAIVQTNDYLVGEGELPNGITRAEVTDNDFIISVFTTIAGMLQESSTLAADVVEVDDWWDHI